jgi:glycosyltransferase involved in cell wall biosynthesis
MRDELGNINIILLNRNYGDAGVLRIGIDHAKYDHILMLPPYEQILPEAIPEILNALNEHDAVVVNRWPRIDSRINRLQSYVFKSVLKVMAYDVPKDPGSGIRLAKKEIFEELKMYGDLHRFFFMLASQLGFRIGQLDIPQSKSESHRRIYSLRTYLSRLLDILTVGFLTRFNQKPLRFFGTGGAISTLIGLIGLGYIGIERLFFNVAAADRPLLVLFSLFLVLGIQLIAIGLVGETIIFTSADRAKEYRIRKIIN